MPRLYNDAVDEEPIFDGTVNYAGGTFPSLQPDKIAANGVLSAHNCVLDDNGELQTRRGVELLGVPANETPDIDNAVRGLGYYDTTDDQLLLRVRGLAGTVSLSSHDGTAAHGWTAIEGVSLSSADRVTMVQAMDDMILSNGTDQVQRWNPDDGVVACPTIPKGRNLTWTTNRLIVCVVADAPDTVFFSDILDAETGYDSSQQLRVGAGDGDPIVFAALMTGTLYAVLKHGSAWLININPANDVADMTIEQVPSAVGCVGPRAWARVGTDIWFLASDMTVRSLRRVLAGAETEAEVAGAVSMPAITQQLLNENRDYAADVACIYYGHRFLLSFPYIGYAPGPVVVVGADIYVYNNAHKCWEGTWGTNIAPIVWAIARFDEKEQLCLGQWDGRVGRWMDANEPNAESDTDFEDWGGDVIVSQMITRAHDFKEPLNAKRMLAMEMQFGRAVPDFGDVEITLIMDGEEQAAPVKTLVAAETDYTSSGRVAIPLLGQPPCRNIAVKTRSESRKLALRALLLCAFLEGMTLNGAVFATGATWQPGIPHWSTDWQCRALDYHRQRTFTPDMLEWEARALDYTLTMQAACDMTGWELDSSRSTLAYLSEATYQATMEDWEAGALDETEPTDFSANMEDWETGSGDT